MVKMFKKIVGDESGDLAEELLVLPIKIMIFVMIVEFSLLLINYLSFVEAYGTCLRTAEIRGGIDEIVVDSTKLHLQSLPNSINLDNVEITGTPTTIEYGGLVEVEMVYPYEYILIDRFMKVINKQTVFHPTGFTTSSKIVR